MAQETGIKALEQQREEIATRAAGSTDPYYVTLSVALNDEAVFDFLAEKLKTCTLEGVVLRQTEPIAILEFEFRSRSGVSLTNQNCLVGVLPESGQVSFAIEELLNSKEGQAVMLPLTAYIESRANFTEMEFSASDKALVEKEDEFRAKIGAPSLSDIVERFKAPVADFRSAISSEWGMFFDIEGRGPVWGRVSSASPSSRYTKCISPTGGGKDGYFVNDDCG